MFSKGHKRIKHCMQAPDVQSTLGSCPQPLATWGALPTLKTVEMGTVC